MSVLTSLLPALAVFGMESTLFPDLGWIGRDEILPFELQDTGDVVDNKGTVVNPFADSLAVLEMLDRMSIPMAAYCHDIRLKAAEQLFDLFNWNKFFKFKEIYPDNDTLHAQDIQQKMNQSLGNVIYFSNLRHVVDAANKAGIFAIYIDPDVGITKTAVEDALKQFKLRGQNNNSTVLTDQAKSGATTATATSTASATPTKQAASAAQSQSSAQSQAQAQAQTQAQPQPQAQSQPQPQPAMAH